MVTILSPILGTASEMILVTATLNVIILFTPSDTLLNKLGSLGLLSTIHLYSGNIFEPAQPVSTSNT